MGKCIKEGLSYPMVYMENVDIGYSVGKDYQSGRVTIVGTEYPYARGASPIDHDKESRIVLDMSGLADGSSALRL